MSTSSFIVSGPLSSHFRVTADLCLISAQLYQSRVEPFILSGFSGLERESERERTREESSEKRRVIPVSIRRALLSVL